MKRFPGKLGVQQRVLPSYRAPFFDLLASACEGGMSLFSGLPLADEGIQTTSALNIANYELGRNIHILGGALYLCHQPGLSNWLEGWDPDALIVEANPRYLATPAAVRWMHRRGRPVLGWGLGSPLPTGALSGFRQSRRRAFLAQFDALIAYSQRGAEEYARSGFPHEKILVAHNAVAAPPYGPPPSRPDGFGGSPSILFVGRLQARKRVDHLLRACAALGTDDGFARPRLVIVGDGPERRALESLAAEIYPAAEFVGARQGAELKPFFAQADLFVLPGTGGLAIQEAMSHGLPVIVARGDGTQDDLVRSANGWQIEPDDQAALVRTMREALSDPARLRRMGAESYRIVQEEINIERMVATFVEALRLSVGK